jgi:hypothetical protein
MVEVTYRVMCVFHAPYQPSCSVLRPVSIGPVYPERRPGQI